MKIIHAGFLIISSIFIAESARDLFEIDPEEGLQACSKDDDCRNLKNSTCDGGYCSCMNGFKVCEENVEVKVNQIGGKCDGVSQICNANYSECGPAKVCVCQDGFVASEDFRRCVKGNICKTSEDCRQPGPESTSVRMCIDGDCKCKSGYTEERGFCKENNESSMQKGSFLSLFFSFMLFMFLM